MEDAKLGNLIRGVLNGKTIQMNVEEWNEYRDMYPRTTTEWLHLFTSEDSTYVSFRVKPKTKVVKYQTRLYSVGATPNRGVYQWNSLHSQGTQTALERCFITLEWLQPTQEHTFEYAESNG